MAGCGRGRGSGHGGGRHRRWFAAVGCEDGGQRVAGLALLLPASLLLPPIPFYLEFQAPFAGILLGVLAIVRLGDRFGARWQVVGWLGVGLSIIWTLVVFAALALMLSA